MKTPSELDAFERYDDDWSMNRGQSEFILRTCLPDEGIRCRIGFAGAGFLALGVALVMQLLRPLRERVYRSRKVAVIEARSKSLFLRVVHKERFPVARIAEKRRELMARIESGDFDRQ